MKKEAKRILLVGITILMLVWAASAQIQTINKKRCSGVNGLTATEISDLLEAHNKVRVEAGLAKLVWNCNLADLAQEWATRGVFEHREDTEYGENLFVSSDNSILPIAAVDRWLTEKANFDAANGVCQTGKMCSHYQQLVSRNTKQIGCGINRSGTGKWPLMLVCNYDPWF